MKCRATCPFWSIELSRDADWWIQRCALQPPEKSEIHRQPLSNIKSEYVECVIPPSMLRGYLSDLERDIIKMRMDLEADDEAAYSKEADCDVRTA